MTRTRPIARTAALLALAILFGGTGHAALEPVEQALEMPLGAVSLPASETGQLVLRRCQGCTPQVLRVTPATLYVVRPSRAPISLREARMAAARAGAAPQALVYVYWDPATGNVRRVVLDTGAPGGAP